jgi:cell division protein FtsL
MRDSRFLLLWTLTVAATAAAFILHLAIRGKTISLGYDIGRVRSEQAKLRETRRVLQVEVASYQSPERVDVVARTILGMEPAPPERTVNLPALGDVAEGVHSRSPAQELARHAP